MFGNKPLDELDLRRKTDQIARDTIDKADRSTQKGKEIEAYAHRLLADIQKRKDELRRQQAAENARGTPGMSGTR